MKQKLLVAAIILISFLPFSSTKAEVSISSRLKGRILLQVESRGEAWYVHHMTGERYYMANGDAAYSIMRNLGIGITNIDLERIKNNKDEALKHKGKIFLQVESRGEAFYINHDGSMYYLKNGDSAYQIMRDLGLGIKNTDLEKIKIINSPLNKVDNDKFLHLMDDFFDAKINLLKGIQNNIYELEIISDIRKGQIGNDNNEEAISIDNYRENVALVKVIIYKEIVKTEDNRENFELENIKLIDTLNTLNTENKLKFIKDLKDELDQTNEIFLLANEGIINNINNLKQVIESHKEFRTWMSNLCAAPLDEEMRTLSPTQQSIVRGARCGEDTKALELEYKLKKQQEYLECKIKYFNVDDYLCSGLKPEF